MKGWKTVAFNASMAVLLVVDQMGVNFGLSQGNIAVITTIGNFVLRFLTDTPVFQKK